MISSPPQEAEHIRGKTLTPESPKPVHYPSPSNIPILEKQMDPMFNEPPLNLGTPASFQVASYLSQSQQQTQSPSAQSTSPYYAAEQHIPSGYQNSAQSGLGAAPAGQATATQYGSGHGSQAQDTSIHNFSHNQNQAQAQAQAPTSSFNEATPASVQDNRPAYPQTHDLNSYAALQNATQPPAVLPFPGGANYQGLLDSWNAAAAAAAANNNATAPPHNPIPSPTQGQPPVSTIPAGANLPPRPPAQDNASQDIRSFHPHSQKPAAGQLQPLDVRASTEPHAASRLSPSTPGYGRQSVDNNAGEEKAGDEDSRWPPEINKLYEDFLNSERKYVTDGQWDQFPNGSRLFIGNLPTEKVTKRDIFHRFYKHGSLAQISIKQAYGFVQFLESSSCHRALQAEQGQAIRGRKMHLEISKPQRNTKKADAQNSDRNQGARRRSRSPDYSRGGGNNGQPRNVDRYSSGQNPLSPRDRDNRRFRDDYRHGRSPSPARGRGMRSRDRSRERYDGRRRSRSRSARRYRSPSPRRNYDDDLPLPHRDPQQVPDVQVLVVNEGLHRDFIRWVEDAFRKQNLRIDVLILSPRLSEAAVVRRQIIEGVLAIVKLDTSAMTKGKINIQIFDRRGGSGSVQFLEYADLDPDTASALVANSKRTAAQAVQAPPPAPYGQNYGQPPPALPNYLNNPPAPHFPGGQNVNAALSSLSQLLGAVSNNAAGQGQVAQSPVAGITPELARLLGSITTPVQGQSYTPSAQPTPTSFAQAFSNAAFAQPGAPRPQDAQPGPNAQGQPDMNELMAQLAKYQR
ncbi:hypothetical protein BU24DRAFT_169593 [Aaosphaeria arxii CBS 175.79]|uniref:RRM domain-containing protein n=1 Tax=Aaosphaeria arxii CBS 175.79 TaxID=1450172 RepID=A0A6A5XZZ0_9PLEO|nr:uncharacterized protein BU24DRAFT_169593 [Aaosphaeria arxii CBS 175.79]KAF2018377.1 hypothetical protein BU24DRAFT_169593 [Aaosphaeria arxii CBS 175.79]